MVSDWQAIYVQLGALISSAPTGLGGPGPITNEMMLWMGRASALVEQLGNSVDSAGLTVASDHLEGPLRMTNAHRIMSIVHRALAAAESKVPVISQGAFIPVGHEFDAFAAIGKILGQAEKFVLVVDPYMDEKVLTEFAPLTPDGVTLRLLTDEKDHKSSLVPAINRWRVQYANARPLEVRLCQWQVLHDRLMMVDNAHAWTLTQSLNAFAARSPATIVKVDKETGEMKIAAYEGLWAAGKPI